MININRQTASSSAESTVVAEEPETISQCLEDVIVDVKSSSSLLDYSGLQGQIQKLKRENEKSSKLRSVAESVERKKAEFKGVHPTEKEPQRHEHQETLEKLRHESRKAEEGASGLTHEMGVLRDEISTRDETVREMQVQVLDLSSANDGLQNIALNLKMNPGEMEAVVEQLRLRNISLEHERQKLKKQRDKIQIDFLREKEISDLATSPSDHAGSTSDASNSISHLRKELSSSSTTIDQLRESLHAVTRTSQSLSKAVDERMADVQRLEKTVSELQGSNKTLENRIDNMTMQMKLMEETATRERGELFKKYSSEIDGERRIVRNLQSSLESLQLEMGVTESELAALAREKSGLLDKTGLLEERCKCGEQQVERLKVELTRANGLVHELEGKSRISQEEAKKEKLEFISRLDLLHRQLDDVSKQSAERNSRIRIFEAVQDELTTTLRHAQTSVNEKADTILELQQKSATLEKTRHDLERQLVDMEKTLVETKETSQSILVRTHENYDHEITQARARIQELQDELSSFITTAQQLHATLETSHADNAKSQQIIEKRGQEISQLLQRVDALQDYSHSLEARNEGTLSQMKLREQAAHEEKVNLLRSHATEIQVMQEALGRDLRGKEERLAKLIGENSTLREELSSIEEWSQKKEAEITAAHATLHEVTERNKASIERMEEERARVEDETDKSRRQVEELQKELREREEELCQLKGAPFHKMGAAISNALGGSWFFLGASNPASKKPIVRPTQ